MDDLRNPYLILGLPYGSDAKTASRAFARASRRVRRGESPHQVEDLTWALHEIERAEVDPESSVAYFRVPADPDAVLVPGDEPPTPPPVPSPRTTPVGDVEARRRRLAERACRDVVTSAMASLKVPAVDPYGIGVKVVTGKVPPVHPPKPAPAPKSAEAPARAPGLASGATTSTSGSDSTVKAAPGSRRRGRRRALLLMAAAAIVAIGFAIFIGTRSHPAPAAAVPSPSATVAKAKYTLAELRALIGTCGRSDSEESWMYFGAPCKKGNYRVVKVVPSTAACPSAAVTVSSREFGKYAVCLKRIKR